MEKIKIENLSFTYPMCENSALRNVSLSVSDGEFIVLCGKSGCGKTTLLRLLKPVIAPYGKQNGKILFGGKDILSLSAREQAQNIGFVMQNPDNQILCDKVWHELAFTLESLSYPRDKIRAKVSEISSFFGIQQLFHKNISELSGGQKQLVNLASAMICEPSVLILDEPTGQLDPIAAREFSEAVYRINRETGVTVILCEHRTENVFEKADRVVVMDNGEIIADAPPREVGTMLKNTDMLLSFPTPMRIFYKSGADGECPVNIREGRSWLTEKEPDRHAVFSENVPVEDKTAVEVREVWFRYEKNEPDIIKGISLKVRKGEIFSILGENGAGKTTLLGMLGGVLGPYRGKVIVADGMRTAVLTQNPQSLFTRKTVMAELEAVSCDICKINYTVSLCGLDGLTDKHPYDLSGGEQQRAALAIVLLTNPDILILDEPAKGLDAYYKKKLALIFKSLKKSGKTIITVSHDIEFSASISDRCAMLFDGRTAACDTPRRFFGGMSFYTTAAAAMARGILPGAILEGDILKALGCDEADENISPYNPPSDKGVKKKEKKSFGIKEIVGGAFILLFFIFAFVYLKGKSVVAEIISSVFLIVGCLLCAPKKKIGVTNVKSKRKASKRTVAAAVAVLFLIPVTAMAGIVFLDDRKYYFISLLIILEAMMPFALVFEGRKPQARELIIISVLCALCVAGREVFAPFPQFKPVAAMVIISGVCFGGEAGFLVGAVGAFVSNFLFGQGPWTPWQMFSFGIIGFLSGIVFGSGLIKKSRESFCVFGFLSTFLIYGGIMNPSSVITTQSAVNFKMIMSSYVVGFPFDLIHALSTVFFLWIAAEPMCEKLERVKIKYGLIES